MKILITGAAGFIGSHLSEKLLQTPSINIIGIDDFIGPTPIKMKEKNISKLVNHPRFKLIKGNLLTSNLHALLEDIDIVYHLAAIPGVRSSWGKDFDPYVTNNIIATQRLLESCKSTNLKMFIYASTSSVYGERIGKVAEELQPKPLSPYGITKLTGEHLCHVYKGSYGIPVIILRYFTVYGPRQRPDMGFHRFIKQIIQKKPITIFGSGDQTRDFTYIDDCVNGTSSVIKKGNNLIGETINIGGNERASVLEVISLLERVSGVKVIREFSEKVKGEPNQTWADISKARSILQYSPTTTLEKGLRKEFDYFEEIYGSDMK
jgi:UDP-glucuronate 4-epimerase